MEIKEWEAWRVNPSTKEFFAFLVKRREQAKEDLATGAYSGNMADEFPLAIAKALGGLDTLRQLIQIEREDLDAEYIGDIPPGI